MVERINPQKFSFTPGKEPVTDSKGRTVYIRAPEITFDSAVKFWQAKNKEIHHLIDRKNFQIVVLTPYQGDVAGEFYKTQKHGYFGISPVATTIEQAFPDGETQTIIDKENLEAQSIYIVSSILTEKDLERVKRVADHFVNTLGARFITLVCPFFGYTREDKNINKDGCYVPSTTNIRAAIGGLKAFVDRMIVIEPHSSATQACAAMFGIPLAPISPWKLIMDELKKRVEIIPEKFVVVQPDKGRNLAATRIGQYLQIPSVSFDKIRLSGQAVTVYELSEGEKSIVKGKHCLIYDDEASTMGTVYTLAEALSGYGAKSLAVCLVHCKFTPGWETKIKHPLFSIIMGTNSRQPIGNINIAKNIKIISLEPLLRQLIGADIEGVNYWQDELFRPMILQEK